VGQESGLTKNIIDNIDNALKGGILSSSKDPTENEIFAKVLSKHLSNPETPPEQIDKVLEAFNNTMGTNGSAKDAKVFVNVLANPDAVENIQKAPVGQRSQLVTNLKTFVGNMATMVGTSEQFPDNTPKTEIPDLQISPFHNKGVIFDSPTDPEGAAKLTRFYGNGMTKALQAIANIKYDGDLGALLADEGENIIPTLNSLMGINTDQIDVGVINQGGVDNNENSSASGNDSSSSTNTGPEKKNLSDTILGAVESVANFMVPSAGAGEMGNIAPSKKDNSPSNKTLGSKANPIPRGGSAASGLYSAGPEAVAKVSALLGRPLTLIEKTVVHDEGYVDGYYLDSKDNLTYGVGQTGDFIDKGFVAALTAKVKKASKMVAGFENLPEDLKAEFVQSTYRGGWAQSPKAQKLFKAGKYKEAAEEFRSHDNYKEGMAPGASPAQKSITARMERLAKAIEEHKGRLGPDHGINLKSRQKEN